MHDMDPVTMVSRRTVLVSGARLAGLGAAAALALGRLDRLALAQNATPMTGADLGYPELMVTITDSGYQLDAQSVPSGYVLLTVKNASKDDTGAAVLGPGPGQTMSDLQAAASTPAPNEGFPPFLYTATIPGGPGDMPPGATAQAIINLPAGDWVVFGEGNQPPSSFTAIGGTPAAAPEPTASVTVTEVEFSFSGLDVAIPEGQQIWKVVNSGAQPHMLVLGKVPAGTTMDQIMQVVSAPDNATPVPGGLQESDFQPMGGVLLQSAGTTVWPLLNLPAGSYVALCFVTDPRNGEPHAMEGMVSLFTVGGGAATPAA